MDAATEALLKNVGLLAFIIISFVTVIGLLARTLYQFSKSQSQVAELQLAQEKYDTDQNAKIWEMHIEMVSTLNKNIAENTATVHSIGQLVQQNAERTNALVEEGYAVQRGLMKSIDAQREEQVRSQDRYVQATKAYGGLRQEVASTTSEVTKATVALEGVQTTMEDEIQKELEEIRKQYEKMNRLQDLLGQTLSDLRSIKDDDIKYIRKGIAIILKEMVSMSLKLKSMQGEIDDIDESVKPDIDDNEEKKSDE